MKRSLSALLVEDSEDDAELLLRALARGGYEVHHTRVQTADAMRAALDEGTWECVLCDYVMPSFSALAALSVLKESGLDLPFIIVSGTIGEDAAIDALKAGAHDFLLKGSFARLIPAIERELREVEVRTQRRRTELALRESESKYRRLVETSQEGIWAVDADHRTTYANATLASMLGCSRDALMARSVFEWIEPGHRSEVARILERREQGAAEKHEVKLQRRDGESFWVLLSTSVVLEGTGRYSGALLMVMDVTEQRKLQAQLMVADRMVSVGMLAAGVAHEINNPLASVAANLELSLATLTELAAHDARVTEVVSQLTDASEAASRIRHIVGDLKVFSRSEDEQRIPLDVRTVMDSAIRMAWNEIRHRARFVKRYSNVPPVEANESRLGQVFLNLLVNAAQAIPEGHAEQHEIRVSTGLTADGRVCVEVRDSGCGMTAEVQARLFTPFFTTKPVGFGTGLGLSICHRIMNVLGGEIAVDSRPGKGSSFKLYMPVTARRSLQPVTPAPVATVATRRGRVLVVEDEPTVIRVIERTLSAGHEVVARTNGQEALDLLLSGAFFDVILCDVMMPIMSGIEFFEALQKTAPEHVDRVVFLTGGTFTPRAKAFLDDIPNARLSKPFAVAELRQLVNERVL